MIVNSRYERRRLQLLASGATGEVLDVGFADWPNPYFPKRARVTGIDLVSAPPASGYEVQLVGDFASTPELANGHFDYVIAGEVVEHVEDPYGFLRVCLRLLRPGGEVRISTPNPVSFPAVAMEWSLSKRRFFSDDHTFYFSPRWVVKMLSSVGFVNVEARAVGLWLPGGPALRCPVGLSYQVLYVARRV